MGKKKTSTQHTQHKETPPKKTNFAKVTLLKMRVMSCFIQQKAIKIC